MTSPRALLSVLVAAVVLVAAFLVSPDPAQEAEKPVVRLGGTTGAPIPGGIVVSLDTAERQGDGRLRSVAQVIDGVEVVVHGTLPIEDLRAVAASIG
jgi:hypothetical protein